MEKWKVRCGVSGIALVVWNGPKSYSIAVIPSYIVKCDNFLRIQWIWCAIFVRIVCSCVFTINWPLLPCNYVITFISISSSSYEEEAKIANNNNQTKLIDLLNNIFYSTGWFYTTRTNNIITSFSFYSIPFCLFIDTVIDSV